MMKLIEIQSRNNKILNKRGKTIDKINMGLGYQKKQ